MWCIRVYKRYSTGKIEGFKLIDENTMEIKEISTADLKRLLVYDPNSISNITLDKNMNPILKNLNPSKKIKSYKKSHVEDLVIMHYCIILRYNQGTVDFIADGVETSIICGKNNTIGEVAAMLGVADIKKLNLFNATIQIENNKPTMYIYNYNTKTYRKLGGITKETINNLFNKDWKVETGETTQDGISINMLENIKGEWETELPLGISHLDKFEGGVNNLKLPISIKTLGDGCFCNIDDLHKIILGKGLKIIPDNCFRYSSLQTIEFSGSEEEIGEYAFDTCNNLKGAIVTNAYKIKNRAFCDTDITLVTLNRATEIGIEAFAYCKKLQRIKLNGDLKVIRGGAFRCCRKLDSIYIPSSVEVIGKLAFDGCVKLKEVRMSYNTKIYDNTFPKNTKIIYY